MKRLLFLALVASVGAATAFAQPIADRHYAVCTTTGIYLIDSQRFSIDTIATETSTQSFNTMSMDKGNDDMISVYAPLFGTQSYLMRVKPSGQQTTIKTLSGIGTAHVLDQNGQWIVANTDGDLYRTSGLVSTGTTVRIATGLRGANAMCVDDDTGDLIVARFLIGPGGMLHRVNQTTGTWTTILQGLPGITAVDHDQRTGNFVVTTRSVLRIVSRTGSVLRSITTPADNALHIDDVTGHIYAAGGSSIVEFDENLNALKQTSVPSIGGINGLTMWGSRKLYPSALNNSGAGSTYSVGGVFPASPNATYVCGIGTSGLRSGINVTPDHRVNIKPDPLFFLSASNPIPFFTKGFTGITNARGFFSASFVLPPMSPSAKPITFVAAAVNLAKPGNLDLTGSLTLRVR